MNDYVMMWLMSEFCCWKCCVITENCVCRL